MKIRAFAFICKMKPIEEYLASSHYRALLDLAFEEDLGDGDHSSLSAIPEEHQSEGKVMVKEDGVLAGLILMESVYAHRFPLPEIVYFAKDGDFVKSGQVVATVKGSTRTLLSCERIVLNLMQQLSGTATATRHLVALLKDYQTVLLDTRKTIPGLRILQKYAVQLGGGQNHRIGLYDMIMLKDNHVDASGSITEAVRRAKDYLEKKGKHLAIEVETRSFDEVKEALAAGADRIMFDNFSPDDMKTAVQWVAGKAETEASGGIKADTLLQYASTGVQFISTGWITHSAPSLDISLKIKPL